MAQERAARFEKEAAQARMRAATFERQLLEVQRKSRKAPLYAAPPARFQTETLPDFRLARTARFVGRWSRAWGDAETFNRADQQEREGEQR